MKLNKNIILTLIFLVVIQVIPLSAQWKKLNNIPPPYSTNYWLEIFFLPENPNYGWVCGYDGMVIRTTDQGKSWQGTVIGGAFQLESIHFTSKLVGYTSGLDVNFAGAIYKTTDGGATWRDITPSTAFALWGNYFLDDNTGMVVGGGCGEVQKFYRTSNGGNTWSVFIGEVPNTGLTDVLLYSKDGLGYASSSGRIWKTTDGGRSWGIFSRSGSEDWQEDLNVKGNTFLVPYSTGCTGGGNDGGVRSSTDGGKTWRQFRTGQSMFGTFLIDSLRGWTCGWNGAVYYTPDGGKTWMLKNCGIDGASLDDFWFINDTLGWVVGDGIFRTMPERLIQPIIQGDFKICEGDTAVLFSVTKHKKYFWSLNNETIGNVSDSLIRVTKPGIYKLTVSDDSCDISSEALFEVTYFAKPDVKIQSSKNPPAFCEGDSLVLSVSGFKSYKWSTGSINNSIIVKSSGRYSVEVVDSNGCKAIESIDITVYPNPKPKLQYRGKNVICIGDTAEISAPPGFSSYNWFKLPENRKINEITNIITVTEEGNYYVIVTTKEGCVGSSDTVNIIVRLDSNSLAIDLSETKKFFDLDSTYYPEVICKKLSIKNRDTRDFVLRSVYLFRNTSFSAPLSQFDINIPAGESREILLCYSPSILGFEYDTLLIEDNCSSHILPLRAKGVPNFFTGSSECDVSINLRTSAIPGRYLFSAGYPYPNPSKTVINVPFQKIDAPDSQFEEIIEVFNSLGEKLSVAIRKSSNFEKINDMNFESGSISAEISQLPTGLYLIKITTKTGIEAIPFVVSD